ncbi:MAG: thiamine pyrophosphate-dependent enzyme, partial [Verrucomicrobiae bacterium]|nr:thiamine pyrophosphate-dependent enzyme [Verrucomicrobiae bacterium]
MKVDPRFLKEDGVEVFLGNELLVKGLLEVEGGTHLWTGYPGSPIAGFFDCIESIHELPKKYGIHATMANNEALSVAMVNGSQMSGLRAITAMKSVGVHVASDALALGNLAGAHPQGGAVIVLGDDPWSDSTQVASDSRFLCKHLMMPVLEPSTLQELKDWVDVAFKLSRQSELYIGYLVTTNQADGGGSVRVRKNQFPAINTHHKTTLDTLGGLRVEDMVLLPPRTWRKEQDMPARVDRLWQSARSLGVNRILYPRPHGRAEIGFVTSGMAFSYLEHALNELGVTGQIPILKLGITYPLDPALISDFAQQARTLIVVEERRGFLEEQVTQIISRLNQRVSPSDSTRVYGKEFPNGFKGIPTLRGLNPSLLIDLLGPLIKELEDPSVRIDADLIDGELSLISFTGGYDLKLISRSPTFCPGCPHRDSASVLIDVKKSFMDPAYMQSTHGRGITDLVFHGDTGCYTMLMFEPNRDLMHNYSGMGLGGGTGAGIDPFITNKQVVFMGDSTFFHSGQVAISNAIKSGQDITFIILDNKTTAMTGHQPVPSVEYDLMGNPTFAQDIERVVRGMVGDNVSLIRTNPAYRESYRELLEENILRNGVKVIIADKECGITFHRRQNREDRRTIRERGFLERKRLINISTEACENCLECTKSTGCPGLSFVDTEYGRKVQTDLSWCVADMACTKLHVCPSFEEVLLTRTQKPPNPLDALDLENFPDPQPLSFSSAWRTLLSGVGGMGIATSTATLVRAGHREGYQVVFCEKNGLAIRNGGVYSQITYLQPGQNHTSQIIPYGKADLILGIDILEAARSLDPEGNVRVGSPDYTSAIINTEKTPTILTLLGREDFDT